MINDHGYYTEDKYDLSNVYGDANLSDVEMTEDDDAEMSHTLLYAYVH